MKLSSFLAREVFYLRDEKRKKDMNAKQALELLARAKLAFTRRRNVDCIGSIIMVIKGMGSTQYPLELTGSMREMIQLLGADKVVVDVLGKPIVYQPGQEAAIMVSLAKVYKVVLEEQRKEDREVTRARKLKLDHCLNEGLKLIKQGNYSDADHWFNEALTHYKDEHSLYSIIGDALMEANVPKRAFPYLSKGIVASPDDLRMKTLYEKCLAVKDQKN